MLRVLTVEIPQTVQFLCKDDNMGTIKEFPGLTFFKIEQIHSPAFLVF